MEDDTLTESGHCFCGNYSARVGIIAVFNCNHDIGLYYICVVCGVCVACGIRGGRY